MTQAGPLDEQLLNLRLLLTAGSGGVGKTTMAATLGLRAARLGRKVVVLTIDPAQRLAQAMGLTGLTGELRQVPLEAADLQCETHGELWAMMLDIKSTSDRMVERFSPSPQACKDILENDYYGHFSTVLAGTQEYMAVEQVRRLMDDEHFDLVILDTPPASHALDFLDAPERLIDGLSSLPVKALAMDRGHGLTGRLAQHGRGLVLRGLKRFTGGPFLEELAIFFGVFGQILGALENASRQVKTLLRSEQTRFYLVTTPGRSNIEEVMKLRGELRRRGFPLGGFLVNRVHPEFDHAGLGKSAVKKRAKAISAALDIDLDETAVLAGLESLMQVQGEMNAMAERDAEVLARLEMAGGGEPVKIPILEQNIHDLQGLKLLGDSMR